MLKLDKITIDKKQAIFIYLFFTFIFLIGFLSGFFSPKESHENIREYAILLEEENSKLNISLKSLKSLKSCNCD